MDSKKSIIIGGGAICCNFHVPRLLQHFPEDELIIVEVDSKRCNSLSKQFSKNKKITILENLPVSEKYKLAIIATPPKFHFYYYNQLEGFAEKILIEKPLTINSEQAITLTNKAKNKNQKVFVTLIRRTLKNYPLIREFYSSNKFGELQSVKIYEGGIFNWNAVSIGSFSRELNGGGVLMDTGPHTLDLLFQVFDRLHLNSCWMDGLAPGIEANCTLDITADDRIPVTLVLSRNRNLSNEAIFHFSEATLSSSVRDNAISVHPKEGCSYIIYPEDSTPQRQVDFNQLIDSFYSHFLLPGINEGVSPEESLRALKIIDKAYEIARPMRGKF